MRRPLGIFARLVPYVLSGVALTLFMAWAMPLLLAMRGLGPASRFAQAQQLVSSSPPVDSAFVPSLQVRRGIFSDWCIVEAGSLPSGDHLWPIEELQELSSNRAIASISRAAPMGCVLAPSELERDRYERIDTGLSGWPFRAFASEAWFIRRASGDGYEPMPEHRWNVYLGDIDGQQVLVALRPLPLGFAADTIFWSGLSWVAVAVPTTLRRQKREKYGKCIGCGHTLDPTVARRPTKCPECGVALRRDPLSFARSPEMHFQNAYVWLVFVSSLDIMLTWKILDRGGLEVNPVAKLVIDTWGMHGAIAFKFALMLWVIVACEILGRLKWSAGRFLAYVAVAISALPVVWSLCLLAWHELVPP